MEYLILGIKIDVDTERGTRIGVPNLINLLKRLSIPATFLFSLGPDNTGRAIKRIFRPGFFKKIARTSVVSTYGIRTLLNGTLLPAPHIGKRHSAIMRHVRDKGFEVGIHCYDHIRWQDGLAKMLAQEVVEEFTKAMDEFERIFEQPARTAGAAGWQANEHSLAAYDAAHLLYASDTRGRHPFFPYKQGKVYQTLQIPTTLPALDELLGRPEYPEPSLIEHYLKRLHYDKPNILTIHAEIEGMQKLAWFEKFLIRLQSLNTIFQPLEEIAYAFLSERSKIPICEMVTGSVDGRSGILAMQGQYLTSEISIA